MDNLNLLFNFCSYYIKSENVKLETKIREFEETLAKYSDERTQRLVDIQRNLDKEIESPKTALDIKNDNLLELRTQNNELEDLILENKKEQKR